MALRSAPKVIFFDAVGTLFHLPKGVGYHYARAGERMGLALEADALDRAFAAMWKKMPARAATGLPRADDDKGWWRTLVQGVLADCAPDLPAAERQRYFEIVYAYFAEAGVWELYPEVLEVLRVLHRRHRLAVISNFDGRLRMVLKHLGLSEFFPSVIISSEVGADKPDPLIFERALESNNCTAAEALHVGDDPVRDGEGAAGAGLEVFRLDRPRQSLRDVLAACARD